MDSETEKMTGMNPQKKPLVNPKIAEKLRDWRRYFEAKLGFRDHWYAALLSTDIAEGEVQTTTLLGEQLLLRRIDGKVFAMKDQCLHRGVPLSRKVETYTKDTITCWYHGWTYRWSDGLLCDILTDPGSKMIGTRSNKVYAVEEAKGLIFVFVGDIDPPPLATDVPPNFLDADRAAYGIRRLVKSNWRLGAENGFDTTHIFIHKDSPFITGRDAAVPLGFASAKQPNFRIFDDPQAARGVVDHMHEHYLPIFDATIAGESVFKLKAATGKHATIHTVSLWMPGILSVENHPEYDTIQYEFYVPYDQDQHMYFQVLEKLDAPSQADADAFTAVCKSLHEPLALRGFNDDDLWAREATQAFYQDDWGWIDEQLMEQDKNLVVWRKLASQWGRSLQTLEHTEGHP